MQARGYPSKFGLSVPIRRFSGSLDKTISQEGKGDRKVRGQVAHKEGKIGAMRVLLELQVKPHQLHLPDRVLAELLYQLPRPSKTSCLHLPFPNRNSNKLTMPASQPSGAGGGGSLMLIALVKRRIHRLIMLTEHVEVDSSHAGLFQAHCRDLQELKGEFQENLLLAAQLLKVIVSAPEKLCKMVNVIKENLGALRILKFPVGEWSFVLLNILDHKNVSLPTFNQLLQFIKSLCKALLLANSGTSVVSGLHCHQVDCVWAWFKC
ncbi:hypothetical protein PR048_006667 [Dryococelus australis]|uniref:Uncharacterized protein n=1 Tax=Dryococelus australis TaxID=614101 RepID=A0ABQ9IBK6_9NEOP|nr:hypothetical protein PR048_006667 [Dryococelus australis]